MVPTYLVKLEVIINNWSLVLLWATECRRPRLANVPTYVISLSAAYLHKLIVSSHQREWYGVRQVHH